MLDAIGQKQANIAYPDRGDSKGAVWSVPASFAI